MFKQFNNLFAPIDTNVGSGGPREPLSKSNILDKLNEPDESTDNKDDDLKLEDSLDASDDAEVDDDKKIKEPDSTDTDESPDEDEDKDESEDELAELEEELKGPDAEQLELTTPVRKREILAKYPNVFKDFPSLEKAYYRELAFTRIFPTVDDAKEASEAVTILNNFEKDLKEGKTVELFKTIAKDDPNAFAKLADTYMENLAQVDERAYHHVLGNITKDIVETMVKAGKKTDSKELKEAAAVLYQFMFGDTEWKPKQQLSIPDSDDNDERAKLKREREEFENSKFTQTQSELMTGVDNRLKSVIDSNIDKKEQMTPFVKKNAIKEVKDKLDSLLKADTRFQTIIKQLWEKAKQNKYSKEHLDNIERAHISKSKSLLPTIIVAVKREALKSTSVSRSRSKEDIKDDDKEIKESNTENKSRNSTASRTRGGPNNDYSKKPKPGESTLEFLSR